MDEDAVAEGKGLAGVELHGFVEEESGVEVVHVFRRRRTRGGVTLVGGVVEDGKAAGVIGGAVELAGEVGPRPADAGGAFGSRAVGEEDAGLLPVAGAAEYEAAVAAPGGEGRAVEKNFGVSSEGDEEIKGVVVVAQRLVADLALLVKDEGRGIGAEPVDAGEEVDAGARSVGDGGEAVSDQGAVGRGFFPEVFTVDEFDGEKEAAVPVMVVRLKEGEAVAGRSPDGMEIGLGFAGVVVGPKCQVEGGVNERDGVA